MRGKINIWVNTFKQVEDKTPHYRGVVEIDGEKLEVSLWINTEIGGTPINMSGQITEERD